jgi:hypothetical protein
MREFMRDFGLQALSCAFKLLPLSCLLRRYCAAHSTPAEPAALLAAIESRTGRLGARAAARMSTGSWQGALLAMLVGSRITRVTRIIIGKKLILTKSKYLTS